MRQVGELAFEMGEVAVDFLEIMLGVIGHRDAIAGEQRGDQGVGVTDNGGGDAAINQAVEPEHDGEGLSRPQGRHDGGEPKREDIPEVLQFLHHFAGREPAHGAHATVLLACPDPDGHDFTAEGTDTLAGKVHQKAEFPLDEPAGNHARSRELVLDPAGPIDDQCFPGLGDNSAGCQQRRLRSAQGVLL